MELLKLQKQSVSSSEKQSYQSRQQSEESRHPADQVPESVRDIHRKVRIICDNGIRLKYSKRMSL